MLIKYTLESLKFVLRGPLRGTPTNGETSPGMPAILYDLPFTFQNFLWGVSCKILASRGGGQGPLQGFGREARTNGAEGGYLESFSIFRKIEWDFPC